VLALKEKDFVLAAEALGVRQPDLASHLLPNRLGRSSSPARPIVPGAIIAEAVLSYPDRPTPATDPNAISGQLGHYDLGGNPIVVQPCCWSPAVRSPQSPWAFTFLGRWPARCADPRDRDARKQSQVRSDKRTGDRGVYRAQHGPLLAYRPLW
jgi:hypothetical protein